MQGSKSKQNKYDGIKAIVVKKLAEKHQVTPDYVRKALRAERDSDTSEQIKKEYPELYRKVQKSLTE